MQDQDIRNAGLKVTVPRRRILEIFEHSRSRHLSAEDVYRRLAGSRVDIGLATIYRVLAQFEAAPLVLYGCCAACASRTSATDAA